MTDTFLITWNGRGACYSNVLRFRSRELAGRYSQEVLPGDYTAHIVESVLDLHDRALFPGARLVEIFNSLTNNDPGVKEFESPEYARERVFRVLRECYSNQELTTMDETEATTTEPEEDTTTMSASKTKRKGRAKKATNGNGAKAARAPRVIKAKDIEAGEAAPVRAGSVLADIMTSLFEEPKTFDELAEELVQRDPAKAKTWVVDAKTKVKNHVMYTLRVHHGVRYNVDSTGKVSLTLPVGWNRNTIIRQPATDTAEA